MIANCFLFSDQTYMMTEDELPRLLIIFKCFNHIVLVLNLLDCADKDSGSGCPCPVVSALASMIFLTSMIVLIGDTVDSGNVYTLVYFCAVEVGKVYHILSSLCFCFSAFRHDTPS